MHRADEILDYWFAPTDSAEFGTARDIWFRSGPEIDVEIRDRFLGLHEQAAAGAFDRWREDWRGCLALIVLFDQFPRNMFRGQGRSFATDARALSLAGYALDRFYDRGRMDVERQFFYLPFEHSEDIADQHRSVALFGAMADGAKKAERLDYAVRHLEIVERFGRFPHRNEMLGRQSTAEEIRFLTDNDDVRFGTDRHGAGEGEGAGPDASG